MSLKKILLVDDEPITNLINKRILKNYNKDIEVKDYTNPTLAFEILQEYCPDVIFLDINMPVMTGWQFLEKMHENKMKFPVILLTSSTSGEDMTQSKKFTNVRHFHIKPLKIDGMDSMLSGYTAG
jgi:CheY-like chemotaxis protein